MLGRVRLGMLQEVKGRVGHGYFMKTCFFHIYIYVLLIASWISVNTAVPIYFELAKSRTWKAGLIYIYIQKYIYIYICTNKSI